MARVKIITVSCVLAVVLVAVIAVEQVAGGPKDYLDCRFDESNCRYCCNHMGDDWVIKFTPRILFRNVCKCTSPTGDKSRNLATKRM